MEDVKKDFSSIQSEENKKTWGSGYLRGRIDSFEHAKEVLDSIMKSFREE